MDHIHHAEDVKRNTHRGRWVLLGFLAVAAFFLWTEHRAHLLGILPYLLLLACPLMHLFHHGHGHGHQGGSASSEAGKLKQVEGQAGEKP